ncbi:MAG: hypothetical protein AAF823_02375 [Planctomycetota bacterium]
MDRAKTERGDVALKAFELSQTLRSQWVGADYRAKRRLLEIVGLNYRLDDVTLVCDINKPFDVLLNQTEWADNRGGRI